MPTFISAGFLIDKPQQQIYPTIIEATINIFCSRRINYFSACIRSKLSNCNNQITYFNQMFMPYDFLLNRSQAACKAYLLFRHNLRVGNPSFSFRKPITVCLNAQRFCQSYQFLQVSQYHSRDLSSQKSTALTTTEGRSEFGFDIIKLTNKRQIHKIKGISRLELICGFG